MGDLGAPSPQSSSYNHPSIPGKRLALHVTNDGVVRFLQRGLLAEIEVTEGVVTVLQASCRIILASSLRPPAKTKKLCAVATILPSSYLRRHCSGTKRIIPASSWPEGPLSKKTKNSKFVRRFPPKK